MLRRGEVEEGRRGTAVAVAAGDRRERPAEVRCRGTAAGWVGLGQAGPEQLTVRERR
jgi:hypothetical protein